MKTNELSGKVVSLGRINKMNRLESKRNNRDRRSHRVRTLVRSTSDRPRLSINISNRHITAQIIDDQVGVTLVYSTTVNTKSDGPMIRRAELVGSDIAKKAKAKKIIKVSFDRGSKLYHGRTKTLADAARRGGLEF